MNLIKVKGDYLNLDYLLSAEIMADGTILLSLINGKTYSLPEKDWEKLLKKVNIKPAELKAPTEVKS